MRNRIMVILIRWLARRPDERSVRYVLLHSV